MLRRIIGLYTLSLLSIHDEGSSRNALLFTKLDKFSSLVSQPCQAKAGGCSKIDRYYTEKTFSDSVYTKRCAEHDTSMWQHRCAQN